MGRDRAAYMREYRARQRDMRITLDGAAQMHEILTPRLKAAQDRIRELEEEVRHLKAELAKRPTTASTADVGQKLRSDRLRGLGFVPDRYDTQPVRAVPKVKR